MRQPRTGTSRDLSASVPARLTLLYATAAGAWIVASDLISGFSLGNVGAHTLVSISKGLLFVGVTSAILYLLTRRYASALEASRASLREQEELYRTVFESAVSGRVITDLQGTCLEANAVAGGLLGRPPKILRGTNINPLIWPDRPGCFDEAARRALGGEIVHLRLAQARSEGRPRTLDLHVTSFSHLGQPRLILLLRDVTEQAASEEALRASERRLNLATTASAIGLWEWNPRTNEAHLSPGWKSQLGYEDDEIPNRFEEWESRLHPEDRERALSLVRSYLERPWPEYEIEFRLRHRDGSYRWILARGMLGMQADGQPGILSGCHIDITDRKRTEQALRIAAGRQAAISRLGQLALAAMPLTELMEEIVTSVAANLNADHIAILELLPDGRQLVFRAGVGIPEHWKNYAVVESGPRSQTGYTLEVGGPVVVEDVNSETRFTPSDLMTEARLISSVSTPIQSKGAPFGVLGAHAREARRFTSDDAYFLTAAAHVLAAAIERKRNEETLSIQARELARSNAELEHFAHIASHDLQEPLRMVASYTQLLARRYKGRLDSDADEFIDFAVEGAVQMQRLISDLLAYSRVGSRGSPLVPTSCEVVLARTLANLQVAVEESAAVITHDPLPSVDGDMVQLVQLFQNLIANAIKFRSQEPPQIHIGAREAGEEWIFSVRDNGIGIDPKDFDRIFVIFQRLHGKMEYPGTGIGLTICKKIVERHKGRIWVDSQPGRGATFLFALPRKRA